MEQSSYVCVKKESFTSYFYETSLPDWHEVYEENKKN